VKKTKKEEVARARSAVEVLLARNPGTKPATMLSWAAQYRAIAEELTRLALVASGPIQPQEEPPG
jgi:hypothetical protein